MTLVHWVLWYNWPDKPAGPQNSKFQTISFWPITCLKMTFMLILLQHNSTNKAVAQIPSVNWAVHTQQQSKRGTETKFWSVPPPIWLCYSDILFQLCRSLWLNLQFTQGLTFSWLHCNYYSDCSPYQRNTRTGPDEEEEEQEEKKKRFIIYASLTDDFPGCSKTRYLFQVQSNWNL